MPWAQRLMLPDRLERTQHTKLQSREKEGGRERARKRERQRRRERKGRGEDRERHKEKEKEVGWSKVGRESEREGG